MVYEVCFYMTPRHTLSFTRWWTVITEHQNVFWRCLGEDITLYKFLMICLGARSLFRLYVCIVTHIVFIVNSRVYATLETFCLLAYQAATLISQLMYVLYHTHDLLSTLFKD
jgi:hypothetical protein